MENNYTYAKHRSSQQSFASSDGSIKYIDKGEGEVVLLLHGVPSSSWLYRKMVDSIVKQGYRVIAPDMLGFGSSDNPKGYEVYSHSQHAKRIIELMDHLAINNWNHVMHDAGGLWTWEVFKAAPTRIKRLVILNTIVFEEGFNPPMKMKQGGKAKMAMWAYRAWLTRPLLMMGLYNSTLKKDTKLTKTEKAGYKQPLKEGKTRGMYYFFTQTGEDFPNYENIFNNMNIPVAAIWGQHDSMLLIEPQKNKLKSTFKIKENDFHIVDAKHFIQEEKASFISKTITDFLK